MANLKLGYLNSVMLIGRMVADPELRYTPSGTAVCDFRIAVSRKYKNKASGETQEETLFVGIVAWKRQAELVNDYLKKGSALLVQGRLRSSSWEDNEGKKRSKIEVVAGQIQFLDAQPDQQTDPGAESPAESEGDGKGEDTPF